MFNIYRNKKILITGHTGFKGSWLTLWLHRLGARITGIALDPKTSLDAYYALEISQLCTDLRQDINDYKGLLKIFHQTQPEIVFHLAAQPLVLDAYKEPLYTFNTNIIGTANILEACRHIHSVKAIIIVTTDKCYENKEWIYGYRENDELGGRDPYSSSKAGAELAVSAYRHSFFNSDNSPSLASVRAGNIIGGGDWAENRILPDCIKALKENKTIEIRNPDAVRPWQHVLEPLGGYLFLTKKMLFEPKKYNEAWNFGPGYEGIRTVAEVADEVIKHWGSGKWNPAGKPQEHHEAELLTLDISKARARLNWNPVLSFEESTQMTVDWYKAQDEKKNMIDYSLKQIESYEDLITVKAQRH